MSHYYSLWMQIHELPLDGGEIFMATSARADESKCGCLFVMTHTADWKSERERKWKKQNQHYININMLLIETML